MSLSTGYLTSKQSIIWDLKSRGMPEARIAKKLKVSRQSIHKAVDTASKKVCTSLEEAAEINKIEVETVDSAKGFLGGYSSHFKTKAFITFSAKNGVQVWYKHDGNCEKCKKLETCRGMLLTEAEDRNFLLPEGVRSMLPSQLAEALFSRIGGKQE